LNDADALAAWDRIISHDKANGRSTVKYYADWHTTLANNAWNASTNYSNEANNLQAKITAA